MKNATTSDKSQINPQMGFETFMKEDGKFYFQFVDKRSEPLFFSKSYQTEKSRDNGIQTVLRAIDHEDRFDIQKTKKNEHFFILKSGNHKDIGRSLLFPNLKALRVAKKLLQNHGKSAPILPSNPKLIHKNQEKVTHKPEKATIKKPLFSEETTNKMPRYKFSIIYYPDSKIWAIKNDFSGQSKQFSHQISSHITDFLKTELGSEYNNLPSSEKTLTPKTTIHEPLHNIERKELPPKKAIHQSVQEVFAERTPKRKPNSPSPAIIKQKKAPMEKLFQATHKPSQTIHLNIKFIDKYMNSIVLQNLSRRIPYTTQLDLSEVDLTPFPFQSIAVSIMSKSLNTGKKVQIGSIHQSIPPKKDQKIEIPLQLGWLVTNEWYRFEILGQLIATNNIVQPLNLSGNRMVQIV